MTTVDPDEIARLAARAFGQELLDAVDWELARLEFVAQLRGLLLELRAITVAEMEKPVRRGDP